MSFPSRNSRNRKKSTDLHGKAGGAGKGERARSGREKAGRKGAKQSAVQWTWGQHAVIAALANPKRALKTLLLSPAAAGRIDESLLKSRPELAVQITNPAMMDQLLPDGAAHQGFALDAAPPPDSTIPAIAREAKGLILVLDQITDPHNVGAIFRLASAFNARGVIMQDRNAPPMSGATAKVAVGAIDSVPYALVTNIANTLDELKANGWIVTGLAGEADLDIVQAFALPKNAVHKANAIVLGAEGPGLRPRVRSLCDQLAKIPMPGGAESLNVATAAAIAAYEAVREQ